MGSGPANSTKAAFEAPALIPSGPAAASITAVAGCDCSAQAARVASPTPGKASRATDGVNRGWPEAIRSRLRRLISRGARRAGSMCSAARA